MPYSPGGGTDAVGRLMARSLEEMWGQTVLIDNKTGGSGSVGATIVARAAPDGHTMVLAVSGIAINAHLMKLPYDTATAFAPVTAIAYPASTLIASPTLPANDLRGLVELVRKEGPDKRTFASPDPGSRLTAERIFEVAGIKLTNIPYKGAASFVGDISAGRVDVGIASITSGLSLIRSGGLKSLGISNRRRREALIGLEGLLHQISCLGLVGFGDRGRQRERGFRSFRRRQRQRRPPVIGLQRKLPAFLLQPSGARLQSLGFRRQGFRRCVVALLHRLAQKTAYAKEAAILAVGQQTIGIPSRCLAACQPFGLSGQPQNRCGLAHQLAGLAHLQPGRLAGAGSQCDQRPGHRLFRFVPASQVTLQPQPLRRAAHRAEGRQQQVQQQEQPGQQQHGDREGGADPGITHLHFHTAPELGQIERGGDAEREKHQPEKCATHRLSPPPAGAARRGRRSRRVPDRPSPPSPCGRPAAASPAR